MAETCFPYGFPTGHSRSDPKLGKPWPRCINAEPGTFGHECGKPAAFIGTKAETGAQARFCASCKETGHDARCFETWQSLQGSSAPQAKSVAGDKAFARDR